MYKYQLLIYFLHCILNHSVGQRMFSAEQAVASKLSQAHKNVWLSDPSTYPVIAICGGACVFAGGYIAYKFSHPDVQVVSAKRGAVIRHWG